MISGARLFWRRAVLRVRTMQACPAIANISSAASDAIQSVAAGNDIITATIEEVVNETPTVKHLVLHMDPHGSPISFQPGQWLDCFLPGVAQVGGYSICSTPAQLIQHGTMEIAVKRSTHPPAQWVHKHAQPGNQIGVRVGGDFVLHPSSLSSAPSLFVAGGIGITALATMVGHLVESSCTAAGESGMQLPATLLYSVRSEDEFALLGRLQHWQRQSLGMLELQLFMTGQQRQDGAESADGDKIYPMAPYHKLEHRRIGMGDLQAALRHLQSHDALRQPRSAIQEQQQAAQPQVYVCGPPAMTDAVLKQLEQLGCQPSTLHSERWW